jgi:predicted nucleic acid-binding Zn ribbon protein
MGEPKSIGELLSKTLYNYKIEKKYALALIKANWEALVGSYIAQNTNSLDLRNKTLYININSAIIRYELSLQTEELVKRINLLFP